MDPAEPDQRIRADLTWLTSSYRCIFNAGCPGVYADRPDDGCCTVGAHFTEKDDVKRVAAVVADLGEDEWQYRDAGFEKGARNTGGPKRKGWTRNVDGERATRIVDGACILLNRPGFPAGPGCALHQRALADGLPPHRLKPEVCWQVPIRRAYRWVALPDGARYLELSIGEYDRRAWGEGGHDFDWYCSGHPAAHTAREPLYRSCAAELRELLGDAAYDALAQRCAVHLASVAAIMAVPSGRTALPLLVHPATLSASDATEDRE